MRTISKFKVTNKEYSELENLFKDGYILVRKVKLFADGHCQLPFIFAIKGSEEARAEFWKDHETTHARFIKYDSIEAMNEDEYLKRYHLTQNRFEFEQWILMKFELC